MSSDAGAARGSGGEAPNGLFISFEGPDGSGKTTQAARLVDLFRAEGRDVVPIHEPGGTDLGSDVRALLVRRGWTPIDPRAEALLFSACRAQLVTEVIRPSLARGAIVVADRFADSTLAYQGAGRGLPIDELQLLIQIATDGLKPDLTLLLDLPSDVGLARRAAAAPLADGPPAQSSFFGQGVQMPLGWNRFEDEDLDFHRRVRAAYLRLAETEPERWRLIDGTQPEQHVAEAIWSAARDRLSAWSASAL
jgi:dTMP kinase